MQQLVTAIVTDTTEFESTIRSCLAPSLDDFVVFSNLDDLLENLTFVDKEVGCVVYDIACTAEEITDQLSQVKRKDQAKYLPFIGISPQSSPNPLQHFFHVLDTENLDSHLLHTIESAQTDFKRYQSLLTEVHDRTSAVGLIQSGTFQLKTLKEAESLTTMLSTACPDPSLVALGLSEILVNAIEHGNLNISYQEKSHLLETGEWEDEINRRLQDERYQDRIVTVLFKRSASEISVTVTDQGDGFDWRRFVDADNAVSTAKHGRGIALAIAMGFNHLTYNEKGNEVTAVISI